MTKDYVRLGNAAGYVVSKTRKTRYTKVIRASKNWLLLFNASLRFTRVHKSKVPGFTSIVQLFLCEFDLVRLPNSIEINP